MICGPIHHSTDCFQQTVDSDVSQHTEIVRMSPPKTFISYSHDSQEHKLWVLQLASRLRDNGVDAILDQWDIGPGGDLPDFMEQGIANSDRVLMICTDRYVEKANRGTGGVGYEKMIVTADLLRQIGSTRVIPLIRQSGLIVLPTFLSSKLYIDLSHEDDFETGFDQLLRELLGAPLFQKPKLGVAPTLAPRSTPVPTLADPLTQFMQALAKVYELSSKAGSVKTDRVWSAMGGSKLFFDHAFDLAKQQGLIHSHSSKEEIWVRPAGRSLMVKLANAD